MTSHRDNYLELTGLEQLQEMIKLGKAPPMVELFDMALERVEEGFVVFSASPSSRFFNPRGTIHGGYAATLLDSACGSAVHSCLRGNQSCTTLELKIAYHKAMTDKTGLIRAEGTIVSIGRRIAYSQGRIVDEKGTLYATATSTLLITNQSKM